MRRLNIIFKVVLMLIIATSCSKYDDGDLWDKVNSLDDRVTSIESQLKSLNSDIVSISDLADVLQKSLFITNIVMSDNGYVLTFSDGSNITISNGVDGKDGADGSDGVDGSDGKDGVDGVDGGGGSGTDGKDGVDGTDGRDGVDAPVINVRYYNDRYYWVQTVNGETTWLTDSDGNMIPASGVDGEDGVTPLLMVNSDEYWMISYDNGNSYSLLKDDNGNAIKASGKDGDSFFQSVEVTEDGLRIVLKDGTEIIIPLGEQPSFKGVDLGLSVEWAIFNLGATAPTDVGGLYFWGDVTGNGGGAIYEAPNVDNISGTKHDIVRATWGGSWRMPSFIELQELAADCVWEKGTVNGVDGMNVTGGNGESIFVPSTGWVLSADGSVESPKREDVENGYYWAGDAFLLDSNRMGHSLYFSAIDGVDINVIWSADLFKLAIRPVKG